MIEKHTRETKYNHQSGKTTKAQTGNKRYSYSDCLHGKVPVPMGENGTTLYQLLMVGCMVSFVFAANSVRANGSVSLAQSI